MRRYVCSTLILAAAAVVAWSTAATPADAINTGSDEQSLFALTNQDRTSNGVAALSWNSTLGGIARSMPNSSLCGFTIYGRSQDMVNRNYFSHVICGSHYVFDFMTAVGVRYNKAGENIGWTTAPDSSSASAINTAFMNSSEHRANILDSSFTQIGIGAAGGTASDTCCGGTAEVMYTEDFIQPASAPPPPPPPPPAPKPSPISTGGGGPVPQPQPTRNSPAPPAPSVSPVAVSTPNTPVASPSPSPNLAGQGREVRSAGGRQPGLFELLVNRILQAFLNF